MLAPWQNPKPTTFAVYGGEVIVPNVIQFAVDDAAGVELQAFAAATALESGMYEASSYSNAGTPGRRTIRWRMKPVASFSGYIEWSQPWETYRLPSPNPVYALISDLRDEGITTTAMPDARARALLLMASIEVSRFCGRTFGARASTLLLDGRGGPLVLVEEPIVALSEVVIGAESTTSIEQPLGRDSYRVYNRHVSELLTSPDDRENPKVEFRGYGSRTTRLHDYTHGDRSRFTEGQQNVRLAGIFGYTDYDGSPAGGVPILITRATMLMVARLSPKIGDPNSGVGDASSWKVVEEETRDQRVRFADLGSTAGAKSGTSLRGAYTGDPEIDTVLAMYARGPRFSAA